MGFLWNQSKLSQEKTYSFPIKYKTVWWIFQVFSGLSLQINFLSKFSKKDFKKNKKIIIIIKKKKSLVYKFFRACANHDFFAKIHKGKVCFTKKFSILFLICILGFNIAIRSKLTKFLQRGSFQQQNGLKQEFDQVHTSTKYGCPQVQSPRVNLASFIRSFYNKLVKISNKNSYSQNLQCALAAQPTVCTVQFYSKHFFITQSCYLSFTVGFFFTST